MLNFKPDLLYHAGSNLRNLAWLVRVVRAERKLDLPLSRSRPSRSVSYYVSVGSDEMVHTSCLHAFPLGLEGCFSLSASVMHRLRELATSVRDSNRPECAAWVRSIGEEQVRVRNNPRPTRVSVKAAHQDKRT